MAAITPEFQKCHAVTAKWEGGWSDHPADPGGKTMYGITEATYHAWLKGQGLAIRPVKLITRAEAETIYFQQYWLTSGAYRLFAGVDLAVYDAAVNSGVSRAKTWLATAVGSNDHSETVKKICRARLSFLQHLSIWKTFGKGWGRRVADIEAIGVKMALLAMGATAARFTEVAGKEAAEAEDSAARNTNFAKTSAGSSVVSGGAGVISPADADVYAAWLLGGTAVVALVALIFFLAKTRSAKARADAYRDAAKD